MAVRNLLVVQGMRLVSISRQELLEITIIKRKFTSIFHPVHYCPYIFIPICKVRKGRQRLISTQRNCFPTFYESTKYFKNFSEFI